MTQNEQLNYHDEVWKDIPGYEGFYQVSNYSRVKSLSRITHSLTPDIPNKQRRKIKDRILKPYLSCERGYMSVRLYRYGKKKDEMIHRLVAKAFLSNPFNLPHVNHKDSNPSNNVLSNLEWCDASYNIRYSIKEGRKKPAYGALSHFAKLDDLQVKVIKNLVESSTLSISSIADYFHVSWTAIKDIKSGKTWSHI